MIRRTAAGFVALALAGSSSVAIAQERRIAPQDLRSGITFASAEIRAMQQDDFSNPGMLWVEKGAKLWSEPAGARSCADCHGDAKTSMKGVATRYPAIDRGTGRLLNLEDRILQCRSERQRAPPLRHESDELLSLTAFVAHQSRGMPIAVSIEGPARAHFEAGRDFYYRRVGQVNIACAQCHEANWGKVLLAETISQGHPTAFPIYRAQWQTAGSLERRLRACLSGVRAEMLPYGAPEYRDLELFLAWRAQGLAIETPGVRR
jgi:L-cysteine S-thiosulfotransferase